MKRIKRLSAIIGLTLTGVLLAFPAGASTLEAGLNAVNNTGLASGDIRTIVGNIISVVLGVLGVILLIIIVYAGFLWMTAGGDEEKVTRAKAWIKNAVIGLIIVLCSYAITYFLVTRLFGATHDNLGPAGGTGNGFGNWSTGSLGQGIIQSHYPAPGATNVARNTKIIVTFKLPIDPTTIIANGSLKDRGDGKAQVYTGTINLENVRLVATADLAPGGAFQTDAGKLMSEINAYTVDFRTYIFAPVKNLGSASENVSYTMSLGPGIKLDGGALAFTGNFSMGYHWEFETGTMIDTTPPKVVSIFPKDGVTVAKNATIQITFDEGVDPTGATGTWVASNQAFSNITVTGKNGRVEGTWEPANQYKTVVFHTNVKGGTNTCGDDIFVLPGNSTIDALALAASVGAEPPQSRFYPPDGITDLAGNSLDANGNGQGEGPPTDNEAWQFKTTDVLDLTPPKLTATDPAPETGNVDLAAPINLIFSKIMDMSTLDNRYLAFSSLPTLPLWYFGAGTDLDVNGLPITNPSQADHTQASIEHERLAPTVSLCSGGARDQEICAVDADCPGPGAVCEQQTTYLYYPKATSGVRDGYQNCFLPACGSDVTHPYCCPNASVSCRSECVINATNGQMSCPNP